MTRQTPLILCFGDSLTEGWGVDEEESYPALLQAQMIQLALPHRVVNGGVAGDTTASAMRRLPWALQLKPDIVILALGANDGFLGYSLRAMEANLANMIEQFHHIHAKVILCGLHLPFEFLPMDPDRFAEVFPRLRDQYHLPFLPSFLRNVVGEEECNLEDGIHPNGQGYQKIMHNIWPILKPLLTAQQE